MTSHESDFINTAAERGFLHQCTDLDALDGLAAKPPLCAYIGFDCTAHNGVDAVHGGAAHQPDRRLNAFDRHLRPSCHVRVLAPPESRDCANNTDSINRCR